MLKSQLKEFERVQKTCLGWSAVSSFSKQRETAHLSINNRKYRLTIKRASHLADANSKKRVHRKTSYQWMYPFSKLLMNSLPAETAWEVFRSRFTSPRDHGRTHRGLFGRTTKIFTAQWNSLETKRSKHSSILWNGSSCWYRVCTQCFWMKSSCFIPRLIIFSSQTGITTDLSSKDYYFIVGS